jgi:CRP-like cAMP-binding protein
VTTYHNHLLCDLSDEQRRVVAEQLTLVRLRSGDVLQAQGETTRHAYFLESGLVSLVRILADGSRVEASMVGREGLVGAGLRGLPAFTEAQVQIPGVAQRIDAELLQVLAARDAGLRDVLARYAEYLLDEARLNAVCNATHGMDQRLAKWLLRCLDRVDGEQIQITQEFVAEMLGVQRTSITASLQRLASLKLVRTGRGKVEILDAAGLKAMACECYRQIAKRLPELGLPEASDRSECPA